MSKVAIDYILEDGTEGHAEICGEAMVPAYYASKKDFTGKYPKIERSVLGVFLSKLKKCKKFTFNQID